MFSPELMKFLITYQQDDAAPKKKDCERSSSKKFSCDVFARRQPVVIPVYIPIK